MAYNPIWRNWNDWKNPQYQFNRLIRDPFFPDTAELDWNDYGSVKKWSNKPLIGRFFEGRRDELYDEENTRYWEDKARNQGFDLDDVSYPIRSGIYGTGASSGIIEASDAVIDFYGDLRRWF